MISAPSWVMPTMASHVLPWGFLSMAANTCSRRPIPAANRLPPSAQPQNRQGARAASTAGTPRPRRRGDRVKRRQFITLLGGAVTWPIMARAQQPEGVRRIGVLSILAESDVEWRASIRVFQHRLQELGWTDGRNIQINYRGAAGSVERLNILAKELAGMALDVLVATNTPALAALHRMTNLVPIVFVQVSDPIGDGFVTVLQGQAAA